MAVKFPVLDGLIISSLPGNSFKAFFSFFFFSSMWHSRQEESPVFLCSILHPFLHVWQFLSWWIKAVSIFKTVQIILFIFSVTWATAVHDLYKDLLPTDITGSEFCLFVCLHHLSDAENSTEKSMASSMHLPPQHCQILLVVCLWWEPGLKAMNILQWARMGATLFGQKQNKLKDSHAWRERKIQDCWQAGKLAVVWQRVYKFSTLMNTSH